MNVSIAEQARRQEAARPIAALAALIIACWWASTLPLPAHAHGNVTPQAVDTHELPSLGDDWRSENPYRDGVAAREVAVRVGASAFNQNCARCHGLEAISGGIAPDLRRLDRDCMDMADDKKKVACYGETDQYFLASIRKGKVRNGAVYMPPFEGILNQEAMWSIKAYLETRRTHD